jgi:hypothetical protein
MPVRLSAAFRRASRERLKAVLRGFLPVCRQPELFGAEPVAIDGAKFKAVNRPQRHPSADRLTERIARSDTPIDA